MNTEKLNRLYAERINSLSPYLRSIPDEDLRQEAYIGIYKALKADPNGTDRYLKNKAQWNQSAAIRKGRSVDNGFYRRNELQIIHYDQLPVYDGIFSRNHKILIFNNIHTMHIMRVHAHGTKWYKKGTNFQIIFLSNNPTPSIP